MSLLNLLQSSWPLVEPLKVSFLLHKTPTCDQLKFTFLDLIGINRWSAHPAVLTISKHSSSTGGVRRTWRGVLRRDSAAAAGAASSSASPLWLFAETLQVKVRMAQRRRRRSLKLLDPLKRNRRGPKRTNAPPSPRVSKALMNPGQLEVDGPHSPQPFFTNCTAALFSRPLLFWMDSSSLPGHTDGRNTG